MLYDRSAFSPTLGHFLVSLIQEMFFRPDAGQLSRFLSTGFEEVFTNVHFQPSGWRFPRMFVAVSGNISVIAMGGAETGLDGVGLLEGYRRARGATSGPHVNRHAWEFVTTALNLPIVQEAIRCEKLILTGHSLGGAIVPVFLEERYLVTNGAPTKVVTFGAPRTATINPTRQWRFAEFCRWMNYGDPVPQVPPRVLDVPLMAFRYSARDLDDMQRFLHIPSGRSVEQLGTVTPSEIPLGVDLDLTNQMGVWLGSMPVGVAHPHNLAEYAERMRLAKNSENEVVRIRRRPEDQLVIAPLTLSEISSTVRDLQNQLALNSSTLLLGPLEVPPKTGFWSEKSGRLWLVRLGVDGPVVACGPSRRKAGRIVNIGNQFLRLLLRAGYVETTGFITAFERWFESASDPSSTIKPTLSGGLFPPPTIQP